MPANVRIAKERELAALKYELVETEREKKRSEMVKKYHMVRFFDRRKAERRLKKLEKQLREVDVDGGQHGGDDGGEKEAKRRKLDEQLLRARVDLSYAIYAPLMWKYCALFPKRKDGEEDGHENGEDGGLGKDGDEEEGEEQRCRGDPVMWERVKKAMEEGKQALEALRDSVARSGEGAERGDIGKTAFATRLGKKERKDRHVSIQTSSNTQVHESGGGDGNDSDGGFFE